MTYQCDVLEEGLDEALEVLGVDALLERRLVVLDGRLQRLLVGRLVELKHQQREEA